MENAEVQNPLLNHLVIEKVVKYLEWKEWLVCRQVCCVWNEVVLSQFLASNSIMRPDLSHLLSSSSSCPVISKHFQNFHINISSAQSHPASLLDNFWRTFSPQIRTLRLELTTLYATTRLPWILRNLPYLEQLTLVIFQFWGDSSAPEDQVHILPKNETLHSFTFLNLTSIKMYGEDHATFRLPFSFQQFFSSYHNLTKVSVVGMGPEEVEELLTALLNCSENKVLEKLEILDENMFCEALSNPHIKKLVNTLSNLSSIKELSLELSYSLESHIFLQLMQHIPPSIQTFKLRRFPLPSLTPLPFDNAPSLKFITTLRISQDLTHSLNFLHLLPALETFHVTLRDHQTLTPTTLLHNTHNPEPHPRLTTVLLEPPLSGPECVKKLVTLCPQLNSLTIRMDNEMLWKLYESAPIFLQKLYVISYDGLTDEGLSGIVGGQRLHPHIGLLKSLRKMTLEMWNDMHNKVTDVSFHHGLMELPLLEEFRGIRTDMSETAMRHFSTKTLWTLEH